MSYNAFITAVPEYGDKMPDKSVRLDLHVHSRYSSDGTLAPEEIVRLAIKKGLNGVAITDHNTIRGGLEAKRYETGNFLVIVGGEFKTDMGEITGLFLTEEIEPDGIRQVIGRIREQGGIVVVPHPFDRLRRSSFRITPEYAGLVDAIECFNSRCVLPRSNRQALEFARRHRLAAVGGSDAHFAGEIGLGGVIVSSGDVREAIRRGDLEIFGRTSPIFNHVRTKIKKWSGKPGSK